MTAGGFFPGNASNGLAPVHRRKVPGTAYAEEKKGRRSMKGGGGGGNGRECK